MVLAISAVLAAALLGAVSAQVAVYGQCGGEGYTGSTTCASGSTCVYSNPYYSQCLPGSSNPTTTSKAPTGPTTTKPSGPSGTTTSPKPSGTVAPPSDDPYTGYTVYLTPYYAAEISAAVATISNSALAEKAAQVAKVPTFTWFDTAAKVPTLDTYLAAARAQQTSSGQKVLVQIIIYDLPDRDCAALASNGEYSIADNGAANYKAYIQAISTIISNYPDVRIVAIWEPDSLANMVTNLNVQKCANAQTTYESLAVYSWQTLTQSNLYIYVDAGHAGWLGWPANLQPAATLFNQLITQAGGASKTRVRGLATNVANYNALVAASPDPITQGNPNYDEIHYINALAPLLTQFPAHFIVDQGRSGVQNIRQQWGDWCNVNNAGFGLRPTSSGLPAASIDAIVWAKPGGECDGTSNQSSARYDAHCGLSDAKQPAPEAGSWFEAYFEMLVSNANPAFS